MQYDTIEPMSRVGGNLNILFIQGLNRHLLCSVVRQPNGLRITRRAGAGNYLRPKTNYKARGATDVCARQPGWVQPLVVNM
jgi:hypothetical protein